MTREEIENYIREAMRSGVAGQFAMVGSAVVIKAIADKWEADVNKAVRTACRETEHLYECGCENPDGIGCIGCDRR